MLWALEELGIPYTLHQLPFPPRVRAKEFLAVNPLGTVPYFITADGVGMSESAAIVEYLAATHPENGLVPRSNAATYARYLNFLHMSDATLTFPQTLYSRYAMLEPDDRRLPQVAEDYRRWFLARLSAALTMFAGRYTCGGAFTAADIAVGYSLKLARSIRLWDDLPASARKYFALLEQRPAYQRALAAEKERNWHRYSPLRRSERPAAAGADLAPGRPGKHRRGVSTPIVHRPCSDAQPRRPTRPSSDLVRQAVRPPSTAMTAPVTSEA